MTVGGGLLPEWVRRIGLWGGALALLFQMLAVPFTMPLMGQKAGDTIVICTAEGMGTVTLDAAGNPVTDTAGTTGPATGHDACDGCLSCSLCSPSLVPAPLMVPALPVLWLLHGPEALPGSHIAAGWFLSCLQARAPPFFG